MFEAVKQVCEGVKQVCGGAKYLSERCKQVCAGGAKQMCKSANRWVGGEPNGCLRQTDRCVRESDRPVGGARYVCERCKQVCGKPNVCGSQTGLWVTKQVCGSKISVQKRQIDL